MVSRGFVPSSTRIPSPDMSFMRLLEDGSVGWQQRGQYAIWTGASAPGNPTFRLLELHKNKIVVIESEDGDPVMHKIASGVPFTIENVMGYWLSFDSDAMWLDLPNNQGQYAMLAVGGAEGKPAHAEVDCPCPNCGTRLSVESFAIPPLRFNLLLDYAEAWVAEFNSTPQRRTCPNCGCVHPLTYGLAHADVRRPFAGS